MAAAVFGDEQIVAMRVKPHVHDEKYTVPVWVDVLEEGSTAQEAETRMWDLVYEVEQALRDDPSLGGAAGIQLAYVNGKRTEEYISDQGRGCRCRVDVRVHGRC